MNRNAENDGAGGLARGNYEPLSDLVADWIRQRIINGQFGPGSRIRQEAVAAACGTSRIPVREALGRLRDEGLVSLTSHVGARVATLDPSELHEIYALRERLEPMALSESVPRLSRKQNEVLRGYVEEMERNEDLANPSRWVEVDRLFHLASYAAAPMPLVRELIDGFWNRTQQYRRAYLRVSQGFGLAKLEHRLLLEAIERRDAETSEALLFVHIRRTRRALVEHSEIFESAGEERSGRRKPEHPRQDSDPGPAD